MPRRSSGTGPKRGPSLLTNVEIAILALADLGGVDKSVHLEHIAERAFKLSPGPFRWDLDEYAEQIDKDKVRVSLTDAEKEKCPTTAMCPYAAYLPRVPALSKVGPTGAVNGKFRMRSMTTLRWDDE